MAFTEVRLLGTGTAFHQDGRGSQCAVVHRAGSGSWMIDCGPTAPAATQRFSSATEDLRALWVTHLHGDHVAGWPFLLLQMVFQDRRVHAFDVHGPVGTRRCLEGLAELCYGELLRPERLTFEVRYHELQVTEHSGVEGSGIRFDALPMDHHPTSLGYRFDLGGKRIAVTGDTRWCKNLERLAGGTDLLLVECTGVEAQPGAHLSLAEIRSGRSRLGKAEIVLVHLPDEVAAALAANPISGVTAAYDGMSRQIEGDD